MRNLAIALTLSALASAASAQEPAPSPSPEPAVRLALSTATGVALGRPDTSVRYFISADVQGPLVVGSKPVGDLGLALSVETLPAKTTQDLDIGSWGNVAQLSGWAGKRLGDAMLGGQHISSSIVADGGFSTAFFDVTAEPQRKRFYRDYGLGLQVTLHLPERDAFFRIGYGRDEAVGARGVGQLRIRGELPTIKDVRIYGRAGLGLGVASTTGEQADYVMLAIGRRW